jgi:hypothetical protein
MNLILLGQLVFTIVLGPQTAPPDTSGVGGRWEGTLTQEEGGVYPEYRMVLLLQQEGDQVSGYAEVWFGDEIYVKHQIGGRWIRGFFLELEDGPIIRSKDLRDKAYCRKTYQLVLRKEGEKQILQGRWQGRTEFGPCVPGQIRLERKSPRA